MQKEVGRLAFYFICTRPAIKAISEETEIADGKLKVPMRVVSDDGEEIVYRHETDLPEDVNEFSLRADGRVIVLTTDGGEEREYDLGLIAQMVYAPKPFKPSIFDLKIHYIGRARGELRDSCALDRLESHGRYQEMVEYVMENQPHRDIWLILGAGTTIETWGGGEPGTNFTEEFMQAGDLHAREVLRERDRIDLTEALLINYFKPEKNTQHRKKLSLNTKLMKRCYESGLTGMHIVFSSLNIGVATYTAEVSPAIFHSKRFCL